MVTEYQPRSEVLGRGVIRTRIEAGGQPLSYRKVLDLWQNDTRFRSAFISALESVRYRGFRWETPPLSTDNAERLFEYMILDAPSLDTPGDPSAFSEQFRSPAALEGVLAFPNLGGDAWLVVPKPDGPVDCYGHLAAFTRHAPRLQQHALWQSVGRLMKQRLDRRPIWLNTAGGGVPWLHVRLDSRPKYYGYRPYAEES